MCSAYFNSDDFLINNDVEVAVGGGGADGNNIDTLTPPINKNDPGTNRKSPGGAIRAGVAALRNYFSPTKKNSLSSGRDSHAEVVGGKKENTTTIYDNDSNSRACDNDRIVIVEHVTMIAIVE